MGFEEGQDWICMFKGSLWLHRGRGTRRARAEAGGRSEATDLARTAITGVLEQSVSAPRGGLCYPARRARACTKGRQISLLRVFAELTTFKKKLKMVFAILKRTTQWFRAHSQSRAFITTL